MELFFTICAFLLFFSIAVKIFRNTKPVNLPPGPRPLPIIGNLHQLNGPLPHRILTDLAKRYGPLMHLQLGEVSTVVVSSPAVAKEVMNDHDIIFASRPVFLPPTILNYGCTDIAFSPYGEYWRQLRKICTIELLSSRRVQTFRSLREKEVLNLIRSISSEQRSVVNLSKKIYSLTYSITAQAAFGKRCKYHDKFIAVIKDAVKLIGGFNISDMYPSIKILERITGIRHRLEMVHDQIDEILENILSEHKAKRAGSKDGNGEAKEDLVDVLLNIQKSGEFGASLTDNNLKAVIYDIFSAGGETSSTTVIWTMSEMIRNPGVMKRAQDEVREVFATKGNVDESQLHELKYLQAVVKESMRMNPVAPLLLPRECSEHCQINGYDIPVKTRVIVNAWAIGRDPEQWTEPEKFNPDRFLNSEIDFRGKTFSFIPFGAGRRMCPGITFALPNVELPLAQLLYHFDWKLPGQSKQEELDMTEIFGLTVGRKHDLNLIPIPYRHCSVIYDSFQLSDHAEENYHHTHSKNLATLIPENFKKIYK